MPDSLPIVRMGRSPIAVPLPSSKKPSRWPEKLANRFSTVSSYFLENYHRLGTQSGSRGLSSTEAMLVIHILDFKWDSRLPFPTVGTLARRLGVSSRHVRDTIKTLEERGYICRIPKARGGANQYNMQGLYAALEAMMDTDVTANERAEVAA